MRCAYLDTSYLIAVLFEESGYEKLAEKLASFDRLISSNLLEAELISTFIREDFDLHELKKITNGISWVLPTRALSQEFEMLLPHNYLKGADLWHVACALHIKTRIEDLVFLTLDKKQQEMTRRVGFKE